MENKIEIRKIVIFVVFISILIPLINFFCNIIPKKININEINFNDNDGIVYNIDKFEENSFGNIFIKGWIINENEDNTVVKINVLCKNINTGNMYEIKTFSDRRNDVTAVKSNNRYDYNFSGFNSKIIKFMLPEKGEYKIMLLFKQIEMEQLNNKRKNPKATLIDKNFIIELPYSIYKN